MLTRVELEKCKNAEIALCDKNALRDLRSIKIDTEKNVFDRVESFVGQVSNPYLFKVGDIVVKVSYSGGKDFSIALGDALCTN